MKNLLLVSFFIVCQSMLASCSDEECLAHGENCSQSYIDANYGGNRPGCCNSGDICQTSYSGYYLTCN